ncbi:MAG: MATE family efflux transporter [Firmicutes bacterium]|nr:MATE family efflux transporter [Bacillota bacterium]MBR3211995.1 MATE family efflux transporter [Bacillota bacterium]
MKQRAIAAGQGGVNNITEGVIWKGILRFAAPLLLGNLFQQLYNMVDSVIVGNFVGTGALAAVGSTMSIINMLVGLFMGMSSGAGVVLAQRYGARDEEGAQQAIHTAVCIQILAGLLITLIGVLIAPWAVDLIQTPSDIRNDAILYLRIFFLGAVPLFLYNGSAGMLQAVGDARRPLIYLIIASVTNIALDLLFVVKFGMGVAGVAVATIIAISISATLGITTLMRDDDIYRVSLRKLRITGSALAKIIKVGVPAGLQSSIISMSNVVVQRFINIYGTAVVAGSSAFNKIDAFIVMPFMSLSLAATTYVGQNIGARKWDRVRESARWIFIMTTVITAASGLILWLFCGTFLRIFTSDTEVIFYGLKEMRWLVPFYILCGFVQTCAGVIRGSGQAFIPMVITVSSFCVLRVIWLVISGMFFPSIDAVFACYPVTWAVAAITMFIYYKKGSWLKGQMREERL